MTTNQKIGLGVAALFAVALSMRGKVEPSPTDNTPDTQRPSGTSFAVFNKSFGNIRNAGRRYAGEITPKANIYKKFSDWHFGAAAMVAHLQRYISGQIFNKKLDTIAKIIYVYAPTSENDTEGYIKFVERNSGLTRNQTLNFQDKNTMWKLSKAMSMMEDNKATKFYTEAVFNEAWPIAQTQNA